MGILRIVRLSFSEDKVEDFIEIFENSKSLIRAFEGCQGLRLYRDHLHQNVFYTYSLWKSNDDLEKYRNSELFKSTWQKTKLLFNTKPMAFSLEEFIDVV
ncbi:MAG: antibiotic biosynthesis monooxygenase [Saprospiraceae bacterium]|jgi:autoinducer 2-degrading protein|nr:antibiotic biosynthesis monooxygenase [Saprospiraceae bacterium]